MSEQPRILDDEVDLERDDVRDSLGRRIDADYVDRAVSDVRARRGRPSMSGESASTSRSACRTRSAVGSTSGRPPRGAAPPTSPAMRWSAT